MEKGKKEQESKDNKKRKKKRKWNKKTKILVGVIVIVVVLMIGFWGMHSSTNYLSVSDIVDNEDKYLNEEIEVKGTVKKDSVDQDNRTFVLTDGKNDIKINYTGSLPASFEEGKDVVVKGTLRRYDVLVIDVEEIVVGCSSEY